MKYQMRFYFEGLGPIPLVDYGSGPQDQNFNFFVIWSVAYQIKGNDAYSNMVANILPAYTPSTPVVGSKGQYIFFWKIVMLHIKLKGMECREPCKQIFTTYNTLYPWDGGQRVKTFFF